MRELDAPSDRIRTDIREVDYEPQDSIEKYLVQLYALHKSLNFDVQNLPNMTMDEKRQLLKDVQKQLGIKVWIKNIT